MFNELHFLATDARMVGRRVRHQIIPDECKQARHDGRHIERPRPAKRLQKKSGHWPGYYGAEGSAEQSGHEFAFLVGWRPARDNVVQGWINNTLSGFYNCFATMQARFSKILDYNLDWFIITPATPVRKRRTMTAQ